MAEDIRDEKLIRGILIYSTGIGMAIAGGKVPGIRSAVCHYIYSGERAHKVTMRKL